MRLFWLIGVLLLVGCEAQSTPIASMSTATPVIDAPAISTDASTASDTTDTLLQYGVLADSVAYLPDLAQLSDIAIVQTVITETPLESFDIVVGYGLYNGWRQTPQNHTVSLVINPNLAPLTDSTLNNLLSSVLDIQALVDSLTMQGVQSQTSAVPLSQAEIRTILANAGYPDGLVLVLASEPIPTLDMIRSQFSDSAITLQTIALTDDVDITQWHIALILWADERERTDWVAQVGENNVIDLWSMPLSYLADETLTLEFTENGLPIPAR